MLAEHFFEGQTFLTGGDVSLARPDLPHHFRIAEDVEHFPEALVLGITMISSSRSWTPLTSSGRRALTSEIGKILATPYWTIIAASSAFRPETMKQQPRIAHIAGSNATVTNSAALVTSNKAREKRGLALLHDESGNPIRFAMSPDSRWNGRASAARRSPQR
jgi:hypothetical protein